MQSHVNILIIDDEPKLRSLLARMLSLEGFEVREAESIKEGVKKLAADRFHVVLLDVKLPDGNGVEFCKQIKERYPETEVILQTAYGNIADGVLAIKNGGFDYLVKGDDNNKIIPLVNKAAEKAKLQYRIRELQSQLNGAVSFDSIIGSSAVIQEAVSLARKVAPTDASVLITGETGTGKEIFALAIHAGSSRASKSFVALNCASFSREILESELFGHKAGAFTGALKDKPGLVEEAHKGTLFLDEIGEMATELQSKLLRFLETGEFYKVGDTKPSRADTRIVAATNKHMPEQVEQGHFRTDLFFRIATFEIVLPSLNQRREDIEALAEHFMLVYAGKVRKKITSCAPDFLKKLKEHNWKGNTRELRNCIERACILCDTQELTVNLLPLDFMLNGGVGQSGSLKLCDLEKQGIAKVLVLTNGNKVKAAETLGIGLTTLYAKIKEYGL
jgi:two-component system NtrC family response regulator